MGCATSTTPGPPTAAGLSTGGNAAWGGASGRPKTPNTTNCNAEGQIWAIPCTVGVGYVSEQNARSARQRALACSCGPRLPLGRAQQRDLAKNSPPAAHGSPTCEAVLLLATPATSAASLVTALMAELIQSSGVHRYTSYGRTCSAADASAANQHMPGGQTALHKQVHVCFFEGKTVQWGWFVRAGPGPWCGWGFLGCGW